MNDTGFEHKNFAPNSINIQHKKTILQQHKMIFHYDLLFKQRKYIKIYKLSFCTSELKNLYNLTD